MNISVSRVFAVVTCVRYYKAECRMVFLEGHHHTTEVSLPSSIEPHPRGGMRFDGGYDGWRIILVLLAEITGRSFLSGELVGQFDIEQQVFTYYREDSAMGKRIAECKSR